MYAISPARFRSFDALLADLTRTLADKVNLPQGVRSIFTVNGAYRITCLNDLVHGIYYFEIQALNFSNCFRKLICNIIINTGESYVCASSDSFKKLNYLRNSNPNWCINVRTGSSASFIARQQVSSWIYEACMYTRNHSYAVYIFLVEWKVYYAPGMHL